MNAKEEAFSKKVCPLVKDPPDDDCFVVNTNSLRVMGIMEYCAKNYTKCAVYQAYTKSN